MKPFHCASETARCAATAPNTLLGTSTPAGWTSLHLDHHGAKGRCDVFETRSTSDLTLVIATAGRHRLDVFSQGRWRSAKYLPGSAGMTPPGETVRLQWQTPSPEQSFETLHLYLPGTLLTALAEEYRQAGQSARVGEMTSLVFRDHAIMGQAQALIAACRNGEPDIYAAGAARWLCTHLMSRQSPWRHLMDDPRQAGVITDRRLARVVEYMSARLETSLTLDELAREAGISVNHFGRRFREKLGMGPASYLTILRIDRARLLLRTTDLPVSEVGVRCGYPRASAFATAFLRQVGETPSGYRASA